MLACPENFRLSMSLQKFIKQIPIVCYLSFVNDAEQLKLVIRYYVSMVLLEKSQANDYRQLILTSERIRKLVFERLY